MIQKNYKSNAAFAKLIGVHSSSVGLWLNGKVKPRPMAFQNILTVLKLKSYDLEAMVDSAKENKKPIENAVVVESEKEEVVADDFESKVVKIMRLQKELPELVDRLEKMQREIETLKNELSKLM
jgi:acetolactate synthase regulatory subunit